MAILNTLYSGQGISSSGGTITGDLTISGDLTVSGAGGYAYSEVVTGNVSITQTTAQGGGIGLYVSRDLASAVTDAPLVKFLNDNIGDDQLVCLIQQDAPEWAVHVKNSHSTGGSGLYVAAGADAGDGAFRVADKDDNDKFTIQGDGSVGIGTITPDKQLEILNATTSSTTQGGSLRLTSDDGAIIPDTHRLGYIEFAGARAGSNATNAGAMISSNAEATWGSSDDSDKPSNLKFYTQSDGTGTDHMAVANPRMTIDSSGNVGIGTAAPDGTLHVHTATAGSVAADGDADDLVVENSAQAGISILSPDASNGSLVFGTPSDAFGASLIWNHNADTFHIGTNNVGASLILRTGNGTNTMILDGNSRISLSNNDSSGAIGVTLLGYQAGNVIASGDINNTMIGHMAGLATTGAYNTYVGFSAGKGASGAESHNIGVGSSSLFAVTSGSQNIAIGSSTGYTLTTSSYNILIGFSAGNAINDNAANGTVAIGQLALAALTSGARNTAVGYQCMDATDDGAYNTAVGYQALSADCGNNNVAMGTSSLLVCTGEANTSIGTEALKALVGGTNNTAVGNGAGAATTDVDNAVLIGYGSGAAIMTSAADGTVAVGYNALTALTSGAGNTAVGYQSGKTLSTADYNTIMGHNAAESLTTGGSNVIIGRACGNSLTTGAGNTYMGATAGLSNKADDFNICIGADAGIYMYGDNNVAVGKEALNGATFTEGGGTYNDDPTITHTLDTRIIAGLGVSGTGIPDGAYVGVRTDSTHFELYKDGSEVSTTGGSLSGQTLTFYSRSTGTVAIGTDALTALTTGAGNVAVGHAAGDAITTSSSNVAIGNYALSTETTGEGTTAIGDYALNSQIKGDANATHNTGIGVEAGRFVTTATGTTYVGFRAGKGITGAKTTGIDNTAVGNQAGLLLQGAAHENTFLGSYAGDVLTTGSDNTCIGKSADTDDATAINQTVIGHSTTGVADNSVTLGNADVTAVFMGQDEGATVYCAGIRFDETGEVLGDYEEGTFTASLTAATPPSSVPTTTAYYTKIGDIVTVFIPFSNANTTGGSGAMKISGLPFTTNANAEAFASFAPYALAWTDDYPIAYTEAGAANLLFYDIDNNGVWSATTITAGSGKYMRLSMTYKV